MAQIPTSPRQAVRLPSRRRHVLLALLSLFTLFFAVLMAINFFGNKKDAVASGVAKVEPVPLADAVPQLDNPNLQTPDLLSGEVPEGVNPTEEIAAQQMAGAKKDVDALGNPIKKSSPENLEKESLSSKPKVIKIDGKAIGAMGADSLPPAPIAGLTQPSAFGLMPAKSAAGKSALTEYSRPFTAPAGKKPVSIIIGGLGINRSLTQRAIDELPADVTLSFAAHTVGLQGWINTARAGGHEVIIEIPMEGEGFNASEPGANRALRVSNKLPDNRRNLDWLLSRAQGYYAVTNYNGELFLKRADVAAPMLDRLSQTGLGLITDGAFQTPTLGALAKSVNLPFQAGFGLIDPDPNKAVIDAKLSNLSVEAQTSDHPIGVGFAYPETIEAVQIWINGLDAKGLVLAPASSALL